MRVEVKVDAYIKVVLTLLLIVMSLLTLRLYVSGSSALAGEEQTIIPLGMDVHDHFYLMDARTGRIYRYWNRYDGGLHSGKYVGTLVKLGEPLSK